MRNVLLLGMFVLASAEAAHRPKILIIYDMEGLSGVTRREYTLASRQEYAEGRKILTANVNAAIRGLAGGGAAAIWVQDGHGSGNSKEPDITNPPHRERPKIGVFVGGSRGEGTRRAGAE